jgi:predicted nucleic acid-binding protein
LIALLAATARQTSAVLWTQDADFDALAQTPQAVAVSAPSA